MARNQNGTYLVLSVLVRCLIACACSKLGVAQVGIFEVRTDVGSVLHPGTAQFDAATQSYTISGSGENMWFASDDFTFVWKKASGDVTLAADIQILGQGGEGHRKAVLMIRQSLDPDAPYVDIARHGDGLTSLQFREEKGAPTHEVESKDSGPLRLRIEKRGDRFYMWLGGGSDDMQFAGGSARVSISAPFYVGLGVCAHNKDAVETARFSNVSLETQFPDENRSPVLYSTLEKVPVASTDQRVLWVASGRIGEPSWATDETSVIFDAGSRTQRLALSGGPPQPVTTESVSDRPLDQTKSADGKYIYFSSNQSGTTQIWRKRVDSDAAPEQLTSDAWTNDSPRVSPDGQRIVFLSYRNDSITVHEYQDLQLRVMLLSDKKTVTIARIMGGKGTLGTAPWSPDGKTLMFVSYQLLP